MPKALKIRIKEGGNLLAQSTLFNRIYGCMIGGAVGDAMGFSTEGMHYKKIRERYGKVEYPMQRENTEGWDPPVVGLVYTDDTVMKHMVCQAIFESNGRPTIDAVANVWRRTITNHNQWVWWCNTRVVASKLQWNSLLPLREVGRDSIPCNDAAMIIGPVGIINAGDPSRAAIEAWDISSLWQNGYSRECAAAMAACHAEALRPEASVESVVETARRFSPTMRPHVDKAMDLVTSSKDAEEFTERYYEACLDDFPNRSYWEGMGSPENGWSFGADPLEVCVEALAFFALAEGNGREAIIGAVNFGRDCDTIAGIAAAYCGALNGPKTIPSEWQEEINKANPEPNIKGYAEKLYNILLQNIESLSKQVTEMRSLEDV